MAETRETGTRSIPLAEVELLVERWERDEARELVAKYRAPAPAAAPAATGQGGATIKERFVATLRELHASPEVVAAAEAAASPPPLAPEEPPVREYVIHICDPCFALQGQMCHVPGCVFCRKTMKEVGRILNVLMLRPVIDGERITAASPEPPSVPAAEILRLAEDWEKAARERLEADEKAWARLFEMDTLVLRNCASALRALASRKGSDNG